MFKDKFRLLEADEIECRIARMVGKADAPFGVQLLLYKDARCDMNILDETVGCFGWQRKHSRDNANCIVSIYDQTSATWVEKEDTGTESNTEAEKGLASDSFKRACFNWGIGRELYTAPDIVFKANQCNIKGGKCYDKFKVTSITYDLKRRITSLVVKNLNTGAEFTWCNSEAPARAKAQNAQTKTEDSPSLKATKIAIRDICEKNGEDVADVYSRNNLDENTISDKDAALLLQCLGKKYNK